MSSDSDSLSGKEDATKIHLHTALPSDTIQEDERDDDTRRATRVPRRKQHHRTVRERFEAVCCYKTTKGKGTTRTPLRVSWPGEKTSQGIKFPKAPVTTAIALGNSEFQSCDSAFYREKWEFIKQQLEQCMRIMYLPEHDIHISGYDVPCKMALALKQQWTVTPTMTPDGMPQNERDTVFAVLEVVEKYILHKKAYVFQDKSALRKMYDYLRTVTHDHTLIRETLQKKRDGLFTNIEPTTLFSYPKLEKVIVKGSVKRGLIPQRKSYPSRPLGGKYDPIVISSSDDDSD